VAWRLELNMKYGMSDTMPVAIAWYGVMLKRSGRFPVAEAYKYAGIALKLQDELKSYGSHAQVAGNEEEGSERSRGMI
jgi:hypothetical protein